MNFSKTRATNEWNQDREPLFRVIHPLDDAPEAKVKTSGLGPMRMTATAKIALLVLRGYLLLMTSLLLFHVLDLDGLIKHLK